MMHRFLMVLALHLAISACGSGPAPSAGLGLRRTLLTAEEIATAKGGAWTAYDVISRLRPEFLRSRGRSSLTTSDPATAVVYVDEIRFGELNSLKTITADQILLIEYINAADATTRFGTDHTGGAILITTK